MPWRTRAVFAALVVLAVAVWLSSRRLGSPRQAAVVKLSPPQTLDVEPEESPEDDRLFLSRSQSMSFREMLEYLNVVGNRPEHAAVAAEVRRGFESDPSLREAVKRFQDPDVADKPGGAKAFVQELRLNKSFQEFGSRISAMPGGSQALQALFHDRRLGSFAADHYRELLASGTARAAPGGRQGLLAAGPAPRSRYASGASGAVGAADAGGIGAADVPAGNSFAPPTPARDAGAGSSPSRRGGSEGGHRAHDAAPLATIADAQGERARSFEEIYPWLVPLGAVRLGRIETATPEFGLWGACFSLDLYPECRSACASDPAGRCAAMSAWSACLDWKPRAECLALCAARSAYCTPWGAGAATAAGTGTTPQPGPVATTPYNFTGDTKADCEALIAWRGLTGACRLGGDCGGANPKFWGACINGPVVMVENPAGGGQVPTTTVPTTPPPQTCREKYDPVLCGLYDTQLKREPDAAGAQYWQEQLDKLKAEGVTDQAELQRRMTAPFRGGVQQPDLNQLNSAP